MHSRRRFIVLVLLSSLVGCGDLVGPGSERSQLDTNRQKWRTMRSDTYHFTINALCFCADGGPVRTEVRGDSIVAMTRVLTGKPVDRTYGLTIEKLFDFIERGIVNHAALLEVTYHPILGYPIKIVYDGAVNIADDEVTYTVSDLALAVPLDH
ncbi:MAG TPA: DUF6174 domain-containing protein [Gemmatimonadaceae bacterium]|nr:DUF6174 domain-containing protein [Gemmatimonadaceae bacterium]